MCPVPFLHSTWFWSSSQLLLRAKTIWNSGPLLEPAVSGAQARCNKVSFDVDMNLILVLIEWISAVPRWLILLLSSSFILKYVEYRSTKSHTCSCAPGIPVGPPGGNISVYLKNVHLIAWCCNVPQISAAIIKDPPRISWTQSDSILWHQSLDSIFFWAGDRVEDGCRVSLSQNCESVDVHHIHL